MCVCMYVCVYVQVSLYFYPYIGQLKILFWEVIR